MSEKTEKATPWKLKKAREKGQVSKSTELNTCIFLLVSLAIMTASIHSVENIKILMTQILVISGQMHFSLDSLMHLFRLIFSELLSLWMPLCLAGVLSIILINIIQTGFIWTFKPIQPSIKRLNPVSGFKKIFSTRTIFETFKNTIKIILAVLVVTLSLKLALPKLLLLFQIKAPHYGLPQIILSRIVFQLLMVLTCVAFLDVLYARWKFAREQRMSKQDLRDEYRQREGDPQVKSRIRQLQQLLRRKTASLNAVKTAQVIITNPQHIAIALKYDRESMPAPMIVCKAQDAQVITVKNIARKYGVPIIEHKILARALFKQTDLNQWISPDLYPLTAEILREVFARKETS